MPASLAPSTWNGEAPALLLGPDRRALLVDRAGWLWKIALGNLWLALRSFDFEGARVIAIGEAEWKRLAADAQ